MLGTFVYIHLTRPDESTWYRPIGTMLTTRRGGGGARRKIWSGRVEGLSRRGAALREQQAE